MPHNVHDNILGTIGHTPLVRLNKLTKGIINATVYAKIETFNPGNSIKDRMALKMIEDAERAGKLKPGGTIIEGTSGNSEPRMRPVTVWISRIVSSMRTRTCSAAGPGPAW